VAAAAFKPSLDDVIDECDVTEEFIEDDDDDSDVIGVPERWVLFSPSGKTLEPGFCNTLPP
jgi:hypothetical protein